MGYTVKGFGEVKQYGINLLLVIQSSCQVTDGMNELGLSWSVLPKAVLTVSKDVFSLKVGYNTGVDDMFQDFTHNRRERDWSVVCWC